MPIWCRRRRAAYSGDLPLPGPAWLWKVCRALTSHSPPHRVQPLSKACVRPSKQLQGPALLAQRSQFRESAWKLLVYSGLSTLSVAVVWRAGWLEDTASLWKGWPHHEHRCEHGNASGACSSETGRCMPASGGLPAKGLADDPRPAPPGSSVAWGILQRPPSPGHLLPAPQSWPCTTPSFPFTLPARSCWHGGRHGAATFTS